MNVDSSRIYFMDPFRSILMMLGVVIHSTQVFNSEQEWLIYSDSTSLFAEVVISMLHLFRMPAFFVISGFFCHLTLKKYGVNKFLFSRLVRIIVPFFMTALFFNSLQEYILVRSDWKDFDLARYLVGGEYVYHLWFLANIAIYFIFSAAFILVVNGKVLQYLLWLVDVLARLPIIVIVLALPFFTLAILALNKLGFPLYSRYFGVINIYEWLYYAPFFLFGVILGAKRNLLIRFSTFSPLVGLVLLMLSAIVSMILDKEGGLIVDAFKAYAISFDAWVAVSICFYIFYRFLDKPSAIWRFLSDASYSVYLFHHVIVIIFGLIMIRIGLSWYVGLPLLILVTSSLTLLLHVRFVKKYPVAEFLFNGKWR